MLGVLARKVFGTANDRFLKSLDKDVAAINALEPTLEKLSDEDLKAKTAEFRQKLESGNTLDDLLIEAFATVREAAKRSLGQRHYDVQLKGGIVMHRGMIAEMKTGEGKTLVATLPVYLNALTSKGVHVVTVNDYLAKRDSEWMGQIYKFLGLTVACITDESSDEERRQAYNCDVTYCVNNQLGFDYLRDNRKTSLDKMVQREFNYAIIDEVDSILIDEARTPLILSGPAEDSSELYLKINEIIPSLKREDYEKDEKQKVISLSEAGQEHAEQILREKGILEEGGLFDLQNISLVHHINQGLRAHHLSQKDVDYIVKNDRVMIIDEFTGRMMEGRRYGDGLHQAIEAKEGVPIQVENQTLASITFQNYFRLYPKLAGMTGTAMTEAREFGEIYKLEVVEIATNLPVVRQDHEDEIYGTEAEKNAAIVELVKECQKRKQPVLVGTVSIEKSESLSEVLKKGGIKHNVLNARYHYQEAHIVAQAGAPGAVTIATNMAGRGTDIKLGGNLEMRMDDLRKEITDEKELKKKSEQLKKEIADAEQAVKESGGLYVIGTERHESRRIDNQLRGRSGRQGDPGASKFFLSLDDDLMRIFGSERMYTVLNKLGLEKGEPIMHPWVSKALEKAQEKVESRNFDARKSVLRYDDIKNDQRKVIYEQRFEIMQADDVTDVIDDMRHEIIENLISTYIPANAYADEWNLDALHEECRRILNLDLPVHDWANEEGIADQEIKDRILEASNKLHADRAKEIDSEILRIGQKEILLSILDHIWKDHLLSLDHLGRGINLRAMAQQDPVNEYRREAFNLFQDMLDRLREKTVQMISHVDFRPATEEELSEIQWRGKQFAQAKQSRQDPALEQQQQDNNAAAKPRVSRPGADTIDPNDPSTWGRVARNSPCPCGSGKKYKHCHGKVG